MSILAFNQAMANAITTLCQQLHPTVSVPERQYPYRLQQVLNACGTTDLNDWLATQSLYPKFFWSSRDQHIQVAALGSAVEYRDQQASKHVQQCLAKQQSLRYYWLSGFDSNASGHTDFPQQLLFAPQIELSQEQKTLTLSVVLNASSDIAEVIHQLQQLQPLTQPAPVTSELVVSERHDYPDFNHWQRAINAAKHSFNQGHLQKVVLARQSTFACQQPIDFWSLFKRWQQAAINSYQIGYQLSATTGFISFTPERLFLRNGLRLTTEAVAGTLPRSHNIDKARQQAQALFSDSKTRHEHDLVVVEIGAKLAGLGINIGQDCGTGLLQLAGLQHLQHIIQGQLPHPDMDAQLLRTLHPTAAVGGLPAENARRFILQHEPQARGLYAGCCGYLSREGSELAVTIRCARVDADRLTLYAGAGIVPQSDPMLEWQELEQKIALPLSLLTKSDQPPRHSPAKSTTVRTQGTHANRPSRLH